MGDHAQTDAMIARLESELEERNSFIQGVIGGAQDSNRDITESEKELLVSARKRVEELDAQVGVLSESRASTLQARERAARLQRDMIEGRRQIDKGAVEYRSAGHYLLDQYSASLGNHEARERLELFTRAAAHQKTSDNPGIVPDPVIGEVLNFIDASRPLVNLIGPRDLPSATWYRPKVTARTTVAKQGTNGLAADEKSELVSQKMTITRLTGNAITYGGYVNVSRQNIDFSSPQAMDAIINDLAAQYAVQTEAALGAALVATANTQEVAAAAASSTAQDYANALWAGVATIYNAVKGAGRVVLAVSPSKLANWGPLFAPVNPQNAQSTGFQAGDFSSGVVGNVSGIPVVMSAGIAGAASDYGVLFSTSAVEVYEQRIGTLQAAEPSVLGVQVAYAGYFTPMTVESGGVVRITNT